MWRRLPSSCWRRRCSVGELNFPAGRIDALSPNRGGVARLRLLRALRLDILGVEVRSPEAQSANIFPCPLLSLSLSLAATT